MTSDLSTQLSPFIAKDWIEKFYPHIEIKNEYNLSQFFKQFRRTLDDLSNRKFPDSNTDERTTIHSIEEAVSIYDGLMAMTKTMMVYNSDHIKKCNDEETVDAQKEQERLVQLTVRSRKQLAHVDEAYKLRQNTYKKRNEELTYHSNMLIQINNYCIMKLKVLRNLHRLIPVINDLEASIKNLSHSSTIKYFQIANDLLNTLNDYGEIEIVKQLNIRLHLCKGSVQKTILDIWMTNSDVVLVESSKETTNQLKEICQLLNVLNCTAVKKKIIEQWTSEKIRFYKQSVIKYVNSNLDLHVFINKQLIYLHEELTAFNNSNFSKIFPKEWFVDAIFARKWFESAKPYFTIMIKNGEKKSTDNKNVVIATEIASAQKGIIDIESENLKSVDMTKYIVFNFREILVKLIEFEHDIRSKWAFSDNEIFKLIEDDDMDSNFKFQGFLSSEFNPYMHHFITAEKERFKVFIDSVDKECDWTLNTNDIQGHFMEADKIQLMIKASLNRYRKIIPEMELLLLFEEYQVAIINYLQLLSNYLPIDDFTEERIHIICATVNTVDIILNGWHSLTNSLELQNGDLIDDKCTNITSNALDVLSKYIIGKLKESWQQMKELKNISENSQTLPKYFCQIITILTNELKSKSAMSNFHFLCQYIVKEFFILYTNLIKEPYTKIVPKVAKQLLNDLTKFKLFFINRVTDMVDNLDKNSQKNIDYDIYDFDIVEKTIYPPHFKYYIQIVNKEVITLTKLLDIFCLPNDQLINKTISTYGLDLAYIFQVFNMRGLSSGDQEKLSKEYNNKIADQSKWIPIKKFSMMDKIGDIKKSILL